MKLNSHDVLTCIMYNIHAVLRTLDTLSHLLLKTTLLCVKHYYCYLLMRNLKLG